jgi:hypothetical protein
MALWKEVSYWIGKMEVFFDRGEKIMGQFNA